jgi:two-component system chemotaxis sensor kinase CheA
MTSPGLRAQLLPIFLAELDGQVALFAATLLALEAAPADPVRHKTLFRIAHTLKGAAHAVGIGPVEHLCQAMETALGLRADGGPGAEADLRAFLTAAVAALHDASTRLHAGQDLVDAPITALAGRGRT